MISVIVPVYNSEKYLEKCLTSLINQTYKNLEIICINDGSTDNSLEIIKEFRNIRIINTENKGPSAARNVGIEAANGEYIAFVDSDDWIDDDYFEKLHSAMGDCDIACASIVRKRVFSGKYRIRYREKHIFDNLEDKVHACGLPKCSYVWNKLYRTEIVRKIKFREGKFFEDMLWTPEILKHSECLVTVPDINYYYRVNAESIVKKIPNRKKQQDFYEAKKAMVHFFEENKIRLEEKERNITKRKKYLCGCLILKIKEYRFTEIFCLFGFLEFLKITQYPPVQRR